MTNRRHSILAVSQVYPPDPASLGQHLADATAELARRGHAVTVFTSERGYANPSLRYPRLESRNGVIVCRFPFASFGKRSILARLVGGMSFLLQTILRGILAPRVDTVLVSTSPPMAGLAGAILAWAKSARLVYWVMDLNPDQAVALGVAAEGSFAVRAYDWMNRIVLRRSDAVVAMDRFMAQRLTEKQDIGDRMHVIAPWPHEDHITPASRSQNPFSRAHGLDAKFVVMYSGNHTNANPLRTVIDAALALQDDERFAFVFVGEGAGKRDVEAASARNIFSLPYEPLEQLHHSLAAADLHVVTMGDDMVGIVHPCKVYGVFAAARPILFVGPESSHVHDYLTEKHFGWHVKHGDVAAAVQAIKQAAEMSDWDLARMGESGRELVQTRLSKATLCEAFCDVVAGQQSGTLNSRDEHHGVRLHTISES